MILNGKTIGRMTPPEGRGGDWSDETTALPGAEHRHYGKTRAERAALPATLAD